MKPERWQKIDLLFQSALARAPEEREAYLVAACADDEALRLEVESLITSHKDGTLLDTPLSQIAAEVLLERPPRLVLGQTFGNYKILSLLGEGGMGEVYLAQDIKLGRQIALKLLPAQVTSDGDRLHRFEQEAYAASALNHPNIVTIHEIGKVDGEHFIVTEFIDGQTLRERMAETTIQLREALDMAIQLTSALAAAHLVGIVHRDIKPENTMLRRDGYAKVLDFGLAKLTEGKTPSGISDGTRAPVKTNPGMLLGTVAYMSPEQARGLPVDVRTDIFSLGIVLYETIAHRLPFDGETSSDVIVSILEKEPIPLRQISPEIPVELEWIVKKALAKDREQRYQTIKDLQVDLNRLRQELDLQEKLDGLAPVLRQDAARSTADATGKSTARFAPTALTSESFIDGKGKPTTFGRRKVFIVGLAAIALFSLASFYVGRKQVSQPPQPTFRQLTFRRGAITGARFSPDGNTIIYGAAFDGKPTELFTSRLDSLQPSSLNIQADIKSISSTGEMAILLDCLEDNGECVNGTLAQLPLLATTPRKLMEHVYQADWAPNGQELAVVRSNEGQFQLEYPVGTVLYKASGRIQYMRVSPKGDKVAFVDQPVLGDDSGSIMTVDRHGQKQTLSNGWKTEGGLAWSPTGDEVWFSAGKHGANELYAVTSSGRERLVFRAPGNVGLKDISQDGRVLLQRGIPTSRMIGFTSDSKHERELGWFDWSTSADITADGKNLLFYEWGSAEGGDPVVFLRTMDGLSEPVKLGQGKAFGLSPDGKWALALRGGVPPQLVLLPTGPGEPKSLPRGDITEYLYASWFPNSSQILFTGLVDPSHGMRSYVQDLSGGLPQPILPEGMVALLVAPDGKRIVVYAPEGSDGRYYLSPINGGASTPIPGMERGEVPIQWSADGRALYVQGPGDFSTKIYRIDLANGHRELRQEILPDQIGLIGLDPNPGGIQITPDGKSYVYTYWTALRDLFLAEGMK